MSLQGVEDFGIDAELLWAVLAFHIILFLSGDSTFLALIFQTQAHECVHCIFLQMIFSLGSSRQLDWIGKERLKKPFSHSQCIYKPGYGRCLRI